MNRREFLMLAGALAAGCETAQNGGSTAPSQTRAIDCGPAGQYAADGLYPRFRDVGFFIVRKGGKLFALSSYCTHRHCKLEGESNRTFYCPCHGSTFDPEGHVTEGPATQNLPVFAATINSAGHLIVNATA